MPEDTPGYPTKGQDNLADANSADPSSATPAPKKRKKVRKAAGENADADTGSNDPSKF